MEGKKMKHILTKIIITISLALMFSGVANAADLIIDGGTYTIANPYHLNAEINVVNFTMQNNAYAILDFGHFVLPIVASNTIRIDSGSIINGNGKGYEGGNGGSIGTCASGTPPGYFGSGAGNGTRGGCTTGTWSYTGTGAGGGGYGGVGGKGGDDCSPCSFPNNGGLVLGGNGGTTYGTINGYEIAVGTGGGGSGAGKFTCAGCETDNANGNSGGYGGGAINMTAPIIIINGQITLNGLDGGAAIGHGNTRASGGGASGGGFMAKASNYLDLQNALISVNGGNGGSGLGDYPPYMTMGKEGGGGRIKFFAPTIYQLYPNQVQATGYQSGTIYYNYVATPFAHAEYNTTGLFYFWYDDNIGVNSDSMHVDVWHIRLDGVWDNSTYTGESGELFKAYNDFDVGELVVVGHNNTYNLNSSPYTVSQQFFYNQFLSVYEGCGVTESFDLTVEWQDCVKMSFNSTYNNTRIRITYPTNDFTDFYYFNNLEMNGSRMFYISTQLQMGAYDVVYQYLNNGTWTQVPSVAGSGTFYVYGSVAPYIYWSKTKYTTPQDSTMDAIFFADSEWMINITDPLGVTVGTWYSGGAILQPTTLPAYIPCTQLWTPQNMGYIDEHCTYISVSGEYTINLWNLSGTPHNVANDTTLLYVGSDLFGTSGISGIVTFNGNPMNDVPVSASGTTVYTDSEGNYAFSQLISGLTTVTIVSTDLYNGYNHEMLLNEDTTTTLNIDLTSKTSSFADLGNAIGGAVVGDVPKDSNGENDFNALGYKFFMALAFICLIILLVGLKDIWKGKHKDSFSKSIEEFSQWRKNRK